MIKILVSGVGGDVAQGVIKCLDKSSICTRIYKIGHSVEDSWLYRDNLSFISPSVNSKEYVPFLVSFIKQHDIDVYIPCIDSEILKISENKTFISEKAGCKIIVGDYEKILICEDKFKTYEFLKDNSFCYPETFLPLECEYNSFPYILKSRTGCGSKEVVELENKEQVVNVNFSSDKIIQEKLVGDEYTAGVYLGKDKKVKGICIFKRKLKCGSTNFAERIIDKNMESYLGLIATKLGLDYVNIQFRLKNDLPCPFEFNGRFSGTTGMISRIFNAPEMWLKENLLGESLPVFDNKEKFCVMRYAEEIYATQEEIESLVNRGVND